VWTHVPVRRQQAVTKHHVTPGVRAGMHADRGFRLAAWHATFVSTATALGRRSDLRLRRQRCDACTRQPERHLPAPHLLASRALCPHPLVRLLRRLRYTRRVPEARAPTAGAAADVEQVLRAAGATVWFEAYEARAGIVIRGGRRSGGGSHRNLQCWVDKTHWAWASGPAAAAGYCARALGQWHADIRSSSQPVQVDLTSFSDCYTYT
jgi:hypothetical protein